MISESIHSIMPYAICESFPSVMDVVFYVCIVTRGAVCAPVLDV